MKFYPFSEIITDVTAKFRKIKASDYKYEGRFNIVDQGQKDVAGFTDDSALVNKTHIPIIIFGDHTRILKYVDSPIALGADGAKALFVNPKLANTRYVYYFLKTINVHGAGYSRHFKFLKQNKIPVPEKNGKPDFDYQIRIAHLLGRVEGLIAHRKQHLKQLDDLLKSVFLEMFGDPVRNEKGWDKKPFSDLLVDIESGKSPKCEARPATDEEWGVLKLGSVTRCVFDANENKALPTSIAPTIKHEVKSGDLLFSRKNTYDLVAACAYVYEARPRLLMPDLIFRFVFKEDAEVNPIYIWKLLTNNSQRKAIQAFAAGAAGSMPNISKTNLKTAQLPVPPIELQNQFATIVEKVEALKSRYQQSLNDLESLYGALSQQAFKGELDLSRVPLPDVQSDAEAAEPTEKVETPVEEQLTINLPDTDYLSDALADSTLRQRLLSDWLKSYCQQIGNTSFSASDFLAAAQTRMTELHPDTEPELSVDDYDIVKNWVFDALKSGLLQQAQNVTGHDENEDSILGNLIELRAGVQP